MINYVDRDGVLPLFNRDFWDLDWNAAEPLLMEQLVQIEKEELTDKIMLVYRGRFITSVFIYRPLSLLETK